MTYTDKIRKLFDSDCTSYSIAKDTGLSPQYVDNYRKGNSKLKNMALGKAEVLINYIEKGDVRK